MGLASVVHNFTYSGFMLRIRFLKGFIGRSYAGEHVLPVLQEK